MIICDRIVIKQDRRAVTLVDVVKQNDGIRMWVNDIPKFIQALESAMINRVTKLKWGMVRWSIKYLDRPTALVLYNETYKLKLQIVDARKLIQILLDYYIANVTGRLLDIEEDRVTPEMALLNIPECEIKECSSGQDILELLESYGLVVVKKAQK